MKKIIFTLIASLISTPLIAACQLSGYRANYTFYGKNNKPLGAHSEVLTLTSDHQYQVKGQSHMQVLWFKENLETLVKGQYGDQQFQPEHYYFHESRKNTTISFKITKGKLDPLSYILNLRAALITNKSNFKQTIQYSARHASVTRTIQIDKLKSHKKATNLGTLETVEVSLTNQQGIRTYYWLAKKYGYLPVEVVGYKAGKMVFAERISGYTPSNSAYCVIKT